MKMEIVILFNYLVILNIVSYKHSCYMLYSNSLKVMTKGECHDGKMIL
jgi:hypothetical protein